MFAKEINDMIRKLKKTVPGLIQNKHSTEFSKNSKVCNKVAKSAAEERSEFVLG